MKDQRHPQDRDRWVRLRFSIVGPLLVALAAPGELQGTLVALSAKSWRHPVTGTPITFGLHDRALVLRCTGRRARSGGSAQEPSTPRFRSATLPLAANHPGRLEKAQTLVVRL